MIALKSLNILHMLSLKKTLANRTVFLRFKQLKTEIKTKPSHQLVRLSIDPLRIWVDPRPQATVPFDQDSAPRLYGVPAPLGPSTCTLRCVRSPTQRRIWAASPGAAAAGPRKHWIIKGATYTFSDIYLTGKCSISYLSPESHRGV